MDNTINVQVLPSPTWRWLKVNNIEIQQIDTIGSMDHIDIEGEDICKKYSFVHKENVRECVDIKSKEDSKGVIILDHTSEGNNINAALTLNFDLKKGADLTVVQVVRLDDKDSLISGIVGNQDADSSLKLIQVFLGGKDVYSNVINDLVGERSYFDVKSAYRLHDGNMLDLNYVVNHIAPKSECSMDSKGVLYKGAVKTYRGTIDFKRGCKGAVGNETEDVLLMDEDVINKSVPIILCAEEDVEGNHGASIGKVSDELMFYLSSRGVDPDTIYDMLAAGRIEAVIKHIPETKTRESLLGITCTYQKKI